MALNPCFSPFPRLLAACLTVAGLMAAEHHGTVKVGGLPVPGASVTAVKGETRHVTTTDENGYYAFPNLPDGVWKLEIEMLGFDKISTEVGVAFDSPAAQWSLKFLPPGGIKAAAAKAPAPAAPAA